MSMAKTAANPGAPLGGKRGIREIPATIRRGARMSKAQLRFTVAMAVLLVIGLFVASQLLSGRANSGILENARTDILREAIGAERIEKKKTSDVISLNPAYGVKTVDGRRVLLLEYGGKSSYWVFLASEQEIAACRDALSADRFIQLDTAGDRGVWLVLGKDTDIRKCMSAGAGTAFARITPTGLAGAEGLAAEDAGLLAEVMDRLTLIQHRRIGTYRQPNSIALTWITDGDTGDAAAQAGRLQTARLVVIVLLIVAAAAFAFVLKYRKLQQRPAAWQKNVRRAIAVAAVLLAAGTVFLTVKLDAQNDRMVRGTEMILAEDERAEDEAAPALDDSTRFVFTDDKGGIRSITPEQPVAGDRLCRVLSYVALALLCLIPFAVLYFFRYERDIGFSTFNTVLLIVLMIVTLYPVLNTVAYSFNDGTDAARGGIGIWPRKFTFKSYSQMLWDEQNNRPNQDILQAAFISGAKTVITTLLNLFWTGMLAFTLTRKEFVLRKFITLVMVTTMYVNAGLIPNYLLITQTLNLAKSFWVYIIPTMFSCFNMIIIRTYIAGLPGELVESARIDGAGDFRIYWQIIFPLCAPVLATVALFVAVGAWNSWYDTMLYNDSVKELHTLQYFLMGKLASAGQSASQANQTLDAATARAAQAVTPLTIRCAITVVTALPILLIYPFLQKYFVTGMALGSVKG